ncbi:gamma-glutamylaminecyclotransferase-like isoform X1 [Polypterus senegalus]|nr:gamma-glutamylaminecyclotransferase-like isoform X1 [Polypterus senegalus]
MRSPRQNITMVLIFVYGTLKRGQPNHCEMTTAKNGKAEYQGRGHTVVKFPLVIAGKYNIPFLLNVPGSGHHVKGEIYSIDNEMLQFLDKFEECPRVYQRTLEKVKIEEWEGASNLLSTDSPVGSIVEFFVYTTKSYIPEWLKLDCHENYDAYGAHGLTYIERINRSIDWPFNI